MRRVAYLLSMMLCISCISGELEYDSAPDPMETDIVDVKFVLETAGTVKSSISPDEDAVRNINVYAFRNGVLIDAIYTEDLSDISLDLVKGGSYSVYALANVGEIAPVTDEDEFREACLFRITGLDDLREMFPMHWDSGNISVRSGMQPVGISLRRLVARMDFSVDKSLLEGLTVRSVRLCQGAGVVRPFKNYGGGGSRAESSLEVIDGDYATEEDLMRLNRGDRIVFYALENCQGILLPDNDDPWAKVPSNIGDVEDRCTYLEAHCVFEEGCLLEGEVVYRFYLGPDNCCSFDVMGNSYMDVQLHLTGNGLNEVSWRVDADVSVRDGYAWGRMVSGLHTLDRLYVGEKFLYSVEFSEELLSYLGGDASSCRLGFDGADGVVEFSPLHGDGNIYTSEALCLNVGYGKLCLYDRNDERIAVLDDLIRIQRPEIRISEFSSWDGLDPVESLAYVPECVINGEYENLYLFLVDAAGVNLNTSEAYGFEESLFEFLFKDVICSSDIRDAVDVVLSPPAYDMGGACCSIVSLRCVNEGSDADLSYALAKVCGEKILFNVAIQEDNFRINKSLLAGLGMFPITLKIVDNGWAGYHDCQLSIVVDNASELPLEISAYQMIDTNHAWSPSSLTDELATYVKNTLKRTDVTYITGRINGSAMPMYVSCSELECPGSGVYPLDGIETEDILKSQIYDEYGNDRMYHMVDVTLAGGYGLKNKEVTLINSLSNGSGFYDTLYLSDWDSKGIWLCSNDAILSSPGNYLLHYPNVTPLNMGLMKSYCENYSILRLLFWHDENDLRVYTDNSRWISSGMTLKFRFYGTVQGYVQTDPKGIWGAAKDNYCSADFDKTMTGVPVVGFNDAVSADGGVLKEAMDAIYAQSFEDKKDGNKFQHSAHPISMDCTVEISVEGDDGQKIWPVHLSWEYPYVRYFHMQDNMTYTCTMNRTVPLFNMVYVEQS